MDSYFQRILGSAFFVLATACTFAQGPARIAVLDDDVSPAATAVIEALHNKLPEATIVRAASTQVAAFNPSLVIALGKLNANAATTLRIPFIAAVADNYSCSRLNVKSPSACIATTPPPKYPLALVKILSPTAPRALLFVQADQEQQADNYRRAAQQMGVNLQVSPYRAVKDIFRVMSTAPPGTSIIATPDPVLFNEDTLKAILEVSYQLSIRVIGYSRSFADAGALAAVYVEPSSTINEIVAIAAAAIDHDVKRAKPLEVSVKFNSIVAESLNVIEVSPEQFARQVNTYDEN